MDKDTYTTLIIISDTYGSGVYIGVFEYRT